MRALILAAGHGKRLGLKYKPKSMTLIGGTPLIGWVVQHLAKHELDICVNLHHLPLKIVEYLGMLDISFSAEPKLMGTAGALKRISWWLSNDFVVVNGDTISNVNLYDMLVSHQQSNCIATIFTKDTATHNGGAFIFKKKILEYIPDRPYSIHKDLIPDLIKRNVILNLYRQGKYFDCSIPSKLKRCRRYFEKPSNLSKL